MTVYKKLGVKSKVYLKNNKGIFKLLGVRIVYYDIRDKTLYIQYKNRGCKLSIDTDINKWFIKI